ncbi:ChbG/HpnK family deacetylase [Algoriphagus aestuarii]|nr:ChbG/HpnK family deacetylase [Algoriphagus aestuarii]
MNKALIINADDFGFDSEATEAILELLENKKISSTTVMANLVKLKDLELLKNIPNIGTGIHLNIIDGAPLSNPSKIPNLTQADGTFLGAKGLIKNAILGKITFDEVFLETKAQLEFLVRNGIKITHADSHQHAHHYPVLGRMIQRALIKLGIKKIRNSKPFAADTTFRSVLLQSFTFFNPVKAKEFIAPEGIISNFSFGQEISRPSFQDSLQSSFRKAKTLEFMTHPALNSRPDSYLKRQEEYLFWKNEPVEEILKSREISLIHYGNLNS